MSPSPSPVVWVHVEGHVVAWPEGETLFGALMAAGLPVPSACSGHSSCGLCVVQLSQAPLPEATAAERQLLHVQHIEKGARLACCLHEPKPYRVRMGMAPALGPVKPSTV